MVGCRKIQKCSWLPPRYDEVFGGQGFLSVHDLSTVTDRQGGDQACSRVGSIPAEAKPKLASDQWPVAQCWRELPQKLKKKVVNFKNINWLGGNILPKELGCSAKIRSTQEDLPGILDINSDHGTFTFETELDKTSPGQACVFYKNDQLLGGGWITA